MTCNRVLILHQGRILADDSPHNLQKIMSDGGHVVAEIAAPADELRACWEGLPDVEHSDVVATDGEYFRCALTPRNGIDLRPHVFALTRERGWDLRELTRSRHSLEDIYVHVTRSDEEEEA